MHRINPSEWAVFLDIDGTIVDIAATPEQVEVPAYLASTLQRLLERFDGAVAIVTGRRLEDADQLLSPLRLVGAGVHGTEMRRLYGGTVEAAVSALPGDLIDEARARFAAYPGIVVEPKGSAIAFHYRQAPQLKAALERALLGLIVEHDKHLMLSRGRMVFEVVPKTHSKGTALEELMRLPVFQGRRPVMIGDDAPDVGALSAAERLGGAALTVAGEYFSPATASFRTAQHVREWLDRLADAAPYGVAVRPRMT